ncbi:beta strand repeat-containing protein [Photobacterium andalusiense]|uniref:DUF11 domain-containing protein n=1 Tax=Photobacterium andalusiense TaxID=2204296 RepID=A0A1Y6MP06_9GAMM|nr:hypothetical protein [Photobacterium andalusiense]SMY38315.1 hypothetical protein PAND9192_03556 [Photobacterium andalusiense]
MNTHLKPICRWVAAGLITVGASTITSQALAATTLAGTKINNQATVNYEDEYENPYSASSNEATVIVAQIYSATLEQDRNKTAAPGQAVNLAHTLTNTGNGIDTYILNYAQGLPAGDSRGTDTIDADSILMYNDEDGFGTADTGEPLLADGVEITLNPGESIDLVLVAAVPVTALDDDTIGVLLTAKAYEGTGAAVINKVTDIGDNNDSADDTNADLIRVTGDAVVNINKKATALNGMGTETSLGIDIDGDPATDLPVNLIRYEIDANNTGNKAAEDLTLFDGVPEGTVLVKTSTGSTYNPTSDGLLTINGDTPITTADDLTDEASHGVDLDQDSSATDNGEAALDGGLDLNGNGTTTDTGIAGVYAIDKSLPPSSSISMTFYVAYSPETTSGDTEFSNTAYACADLDGDGAYDGPGECNDPDPLTKGPDTSNKTKTDSETKYGVTISDTGIDHNGDFTGNGGGDEDSTANDIQRVDTAAAGSNVVFFNIVTNNGNKADTFNLSYDTGTSTFPTDTVVEYWNATGTAKLLDTSVPSDSIDDTGSIPASTCTDADTTQYGFTIKCNQKLIQVVAKLPADGGEKATESTLKVSATSDGDPSKTDDKTESLGAITGPTVDVANRPFIPADMTPDPAANVHPVDVSDGFTNADIATAFDNVALGSIVDANIYIANKGGTGDSFSLAAEGSYNTTTTSWNPLLPTGWSVKFYDGGITSGLDGSVIAAATNTEITATATLPANSVQLVVAKIQVPTDAVQALADSNQANAIDGSDTLDGDKDYIISIVVESASTGAKDRKVESIDVESLAAISITPPALTNQVQAGGTANYQHKLTNTGNTVEVIEITSSNNKPDFTNTIRIDTDGNGSPDTELGNICADAFAAGSIDVLQPDGVTILTIPVTCDDATDTTPEFTLNPGEEIPLDVKVLTPNSAGAGLVNQTTINAVTTGGSGLAVDAKDSTEIVDGMVRLSKYAALDSDCDGTPNTPKSFKVQIEGVEPGHCIIWKLVAWNQGTTDAMNTVISDQLTEYTDFVTVGGVLGGLSKCLNTLDTTTIKFFPDADYALADEDIGALCNSTIGTTGGSITDSLVGNDVTFNVGTLTAGDKAVGQFIVKVK